MKSILKNSILSISALVLMNGIQQLVIYPYLTNQLGTAAFGDVLVALGIIAIAAPSIGLAVNNTRIVAQQNYTCTNGDTDLTLLLLLIPGAAVTGFFLRDYFTDWISFFLALLLFVFTALKNYSDVEYRLSLNYRNYFIYYTAISAGYLIGILLYHWTKSWVAALLVGECLGFLFVLLTGSIYKNPFDRSPQFKRFLGNSALLCASYLLYNGVLNLDRILLKWLIDSDTVTIYYVSSLIGKMIALLIGPLNSIAISYLSKRKEPLNQRMFALMVGGTIAVSAVFYVGTCIATPIFARLVYPDLYETVLLYSPIANLSQICCFAGSFLLTVVLTIASNRWQMVIQSVYAVIFLIASICFCKLWGFHGFLLGLIVANGLRLLLTIAVGFYYSKDKSEKRGYNR